MVRCRIILYGVGVAMWVRRDSVGSMIGGDRPRVRYEGRRWGEGVKGGGGDGVIMVGGVGAGFTARIFCGWVSAGLAG